MSRIFSHLVRAVALFAFAGAVSLHAANISLAWDDNSTDEEGFRIERALTADGIFGEIGTVGANVLTYTDTTAADATGYSYKVRAYYNSDSLTGSPSSRLDSDYSNIVSNSPLITTQPAANQTVTAFTSVSFTVVATAAPAPSYQWQRNGVDVPGATAATYNIPSVTTAQAGTYTVNISNGIPPNVTSANSVLVVNPASQTITFDPLAAKTFGNPPFAVGATASSGLTPTYSIFSGPATIVGDTVTITGAGTVTVRASQAGSADYLAATPVDRSFTVSQATQTIAFDPVGAKTFLDAPFGVTANATSGLATSLSIFSGPGTILGGTVTITGAGTIVVRATQAGNANYLAAPVADLNVVVAKAGQTITFGALAGMTFGDPPLILGATASSTLPVSYVSSNPAVATIAGSTLTLTGIGSTTVTASQAGNANYLAATSVDQVLNVAGVAPAFTLQPASKSVASTGNTSFTVAASGFPVPTFHWQVSTDGGANFVNVPNAAPYSGIGTATLTITGVTNALNANQYRAVATNSVSPTNSAAATLTVNDNAPLFTTHPGSSSVVAPGDTSFTVVATGTPLPTYQWQVSSDGGATWANVVNGAPYAGATTATLTLTGATTALNGNRYRAIATNAVDSAASNAAVLTVSPPGPSEFPPNFLLHPLSRTVTSGSSVTFSTAVDGNPTPTLQWFKNGVAIPFATNVSLTLNNVTTDNAGTYKLVATNSEGVGESSEAILTVNTLPTVTLQPAATSVEIGASAFFTVAGVGVPAPTFKWQRDGEDIPGATGTTLAITNVQPGSAGLYNAVLTNSVGSISSQAAALGVATTAKVGGTAEEIAQNIEHPNGNIYDQVLLNGPSAVVTADPGQVTRVSFIDLNDDIVQVQLSGAGTLVLSLAAASGPALPVKYNQDILYMKGHATITVTGANATTYLSVFSVGPITAVNQSLFKAGVTYDGVADVALISISSPTGAFGGLLTANTGFFGTSGSTGVHAPNVIFAGPIYVSDITASDTASPVFKIGSGSDVQITGGDLLQTNDRAVEVSGIAQLKFTAGTTSHNVPLPAQMNRARLETNGVDVTNSIVVNPGP